VAFPVTPMLDMAFQLLAFFILTFQAPSRETRLDLYLPSAPITLPAAPRGEATPPRSSLSEPDLETDLPIRARADRQGRLEALTLGGTALANVDALTDRLRHYNSLLEGRPLRIQLVADDSLNYEEAARIVGACSIAGVASLRLVEPSGTVP
jgi:biopolymer transport protein ExbD